MHSDSLILWHMKLFAACQFPGVGHVAKGGLVKAFCNSILLLSVLVASFHILESDDSIGNSYIHELDQ